MFASEDIAKNLRLALRLLELAVPICAEAGIETSRDSSHDEWEDLVQAVFRSFVILPIADSGVDYERREFKKLGFEVTTENAVICFDLGGQKYFINNVVRTDGGRMGVEACPFGGRDDKKCIMCSISEVLEPYVAQIGPGRPE